MPSDHPALIPSALNRPIYARFIYYISLTCALFVLATLLHYVWRRINTSERTGDFLHFYTAALALRNGQNPYEVAAPGYPKPGYIYPPLIAFLYVPLTYIRDIFVAARTSLLIDVLTLALALGVGAKAMLERCGEIVNIRNSWKWTLTLCLGLLLSLDKTKGEFQMLQTNVFVLAALMIALWSLDRSAIATGLCLGFAINIKYQALIILPYLLLRRRWKAAGSTFAWTLIFAMLPSLMVGFGTEARYLTMAFGGLLHLVGIHPAGAPGVTAQIEDIASMLSISVTSAIARGLNAIGSHVSPMAVTAVIGMAWLTILALLYRAAGVPLLRWPRPGKNGGQQTDPWVQWVAVEWMILIVTVLSFSPQTNSRHLLLVTIVNLGAIALILTSRPTARLLWPVIVGIVIIWTGLNLPPGRMTVTTVTRTVGEHQIVTLQESEAPAARFWRSIGGPSWALLAGTLFIAWAGLKQKKPTDSPSPLANAKNDEHSQKLEPCA